MEISKMLMRTTRLTLDAMFKASNADIRLHDIDRVPADQPCLFVVNHFTRMETTFLPYLLNKHTKKYTISLASEEFFGGGFGKVLGKLGAVSTKDPDRDRIFMNALLKDEYHTVIFPEGQMIKDKKIIEKGKYMIYNMGIRRPPHRGAAKIALKSEFIRKHIKCLRESGRVVELAKLLEFYKLEKKDLDRITSLETMIVPVNITYYPIRARNNAINRLVERFMKNVPERLTEELEIEGAMVIDGVDIDINFGEPIPVSGWLDSSPQICRIAHGTDIFLNQAEFEKNVPLNKPALDLMFTYMNSIYGMTTVNHDHIFSFILSGYSRNRIHENDFKNRASLAIENIRELNLTNFHTTLGKRQNFLPADEFQDKYYSFMEAAKSAGLVELEGPWIIRGSRKFKTDHPFHTIRIDNFVEVLNNEIEPIPALTRLLRRVMLLPGFWIKRIIRKKFLKIDADKFRRDYEEYYHEEETKPESVGAPFFKKPFFADKGVILIHGYMAAPEEIKVLADEMYKKGYAVYGVRLRGHGTSPEDLAGRSWQEWYDSVNRAYVVMKNSVRQFAIAGFSTGAGLALLQASYKGKKLKGVISISAPLKLQSISSRLSSAVVLWNRFLDKIHVEAGRMEFVKNEPENPEINYLRNPIHGVRELEKLMIQVEGRLKYINIPALIIQGSHDPVVNPKSADEILSRIEFRDKKLVMISSNRHGIVRGEEAAEVAAEIDEFLKRIFY
jgi:esterase/lipase/1-acyl-sn-glycerol-3-phosphate acyltransferase